MNVAQVRSGSMMMTSVLGAPGVGKTAVAPLLQVALRTYVILDWDDFMEPASELAGRDITRSPSTWPAYRHLVRHVVDTIQPAPLVMLGVCTPDELNDWPASRWVLLDCSDDERRRRLAPRMNPSAAEDAVADASRYRRLGLPRIDTTACTPDIVAGMLADHIRRLHR
jgi:hypothetical protein